MLTEFMLIKFKIQDITVMHLLEKNGSIIHSELAEQAGQQGGFHPQSARHGHHLWQNP